MEQIVTDFFGGVNKPQITQIVTDFLIVWNSMGFGDKHGLEIRADGVLSFVMFQFLSGALTLLAGSPTLCAVGLTLFAGSSTLRAGWLTLLADASTLRVGRLTLLAGGSTLLAGTITLLDSPSTLSAGSLTLYKKKSSPKKALLWYLIFV